MEAVAILWRPLTTITTMPGVVAREGQQSLFVETRMQFWYVMTTE